MSCLTFLTIFTSTLTRHLKFSFVFCSLEPNRLKTPQTVSICIKFCQLYRAVWNCISFLVNSCISFCSDLYQSNSFIKLSELFRVSLVRTVTVKSNNWNLAWPEILCTNFCVKNLEIYQSLFAEHSIYFS